MIPAVVQGAGVEEAKHLVRVGVGVRVRVRVRVRARARAMARARARVRVRVREHCVAKRVPTEKATLRSRSVNLGCRGTRYVRHARGWNACDLHTVVPSPGRAALSPWYVQRARGWYA